MIRLLLRGGLQLVTQSLMAVSMQAHWPGCVPMIENEMLPICLTIVHTIKIEISISNHRKEEANRAHINIDTGEAFTETFVVFEGKTVYFIIPTAL